MPLHDALNRCSFALRCCLGAVTDSNDKRSQEVQPVPPTIDVALQLPAQQLRSLQSASTRTKCWTMPPPFNFCFLASLRAPSFPPQTLAALNDGSWPGGWRCRCRCCRSETQYLFQSSRLSLASFEGAVVADIDLSLAFESKMLPRFGRENSGHDSTMDIRNESDILRRTSV